MTPEFFLTRTPAYNVDNDDGYVKYKSDIYRWHQTEGVNSIINNYRKLINQEAYNINYEQKIVYNMGIDIKLIETSNIHGVLLYKLLDEYLETRGTKTSFNIIFELMFNKPVDIIYPRDYLFDISNYKYLRTNQIVMSGVYQLNAKCGLRGLRSGTKTGIESVQPYYINGQRYYIVNCNNIDDEFIINEPIEVTNLDYNMVYDELNLPLIDLQILDGGKYYSVGDKIIPSTNVFQNTYFIVDRVSKGGIDTITIINGGSGYAVGDIIKTVTKSHFRGEVVEVDVNGAITKVRLTNRGYNFYAIPDYKIDSLHGVGATLVLDSNSIGVVESVKINDGGLLHATGNITYEIISQHGIGLTVKSVATPSYKRMEYKNHKTDTYPKHTLHDSFTMHSHVYNIISSVPASKYTDVIMKYNNPSGYTFISHYTTLNNINDYIFGVSCELIRE